MILYLFFFSAYKSSKHFTNLHFIYSQQIIKANVLIISEKAVKLLHFTTVQKQTKVSWHLKHSLDCQGQDMHQSIIWCYWNACWTISTVISVIFAAALWLTRPYFIGGQWSQKWSTSAVLQSCFVETAGRQFKSF